MDRTLDGGKQMKFNSKLRHVYSHKWQRRKNDLKLIKIYNEDKSFECQTVRGLERSPDYIYLYHGPMI